MSTPRKVRCSIEAIADHGERVYSVDLAPTNPAPMFRPGQFLHLTVDEYDPSSFWPESRVFSIASSPRDRRHIRICYSVKGRYTTRMEQKLKPGSEVWIKMPYGDFVIDDTHDAVLFAGGTGISAFTAFLEALTPERAQSVTLVYGARMPGLFLFQDMILSQFARLPKLQLILFSETLDAAFHLKMAALPKSVRCLSGRIALDQVWAHIGSPGNQVFYISGPPAMLAALDAALRTDGVAPERIRTDAWE
jgi:ferredoxin-NADP reductase